MRLSWPIAVALFGSTLLSLAGPASAADHADGPAVVNSPVADLTDLYAWESADGTQTYFIVNTLPGAAKTATFSSRIQYALHVTAAEKYGETDPSKITRTNLICQFDTDQTIHCWMGQGSNTGISSAADYATGSASATTGLTGVNGKFQVFAGPRNDPFFFNLDGYNAAVNLVQQSFNGTNGVRIDASGCPTLATGTPTAVAAQLAGSPATSGGAPGAPVDAYAKKNVLALVFAVKTQALTGGNNPVLGVWASTHAKP